MPEGFVPLADLVALGGAVVPVPLPEPVVASTRSTAESPTERDLGEPIAAYGPGDVARELTLLRLAAFEAYARLRGELLAAFAREVLGRELALAPCDVERLATGVLARVGAHEPLALRLSPGDAPFVALDLPVVVDPTLAAGDLVVDVRDGTIDARFTLRFSRLLAETGP